MFNAAEAMWFSPNGTSLAVASFNDTQVESAVYPYYGEPSEFDNQYPLLVAFKYPKVSFHHRQIIFLYTGHVIFAPKILKI